MSEPKTCIVDKNLEDRTETKKTERLIDRVIRSMFASDASGYQFIDEKLVKSEGIKRIRSLLERLDGEKRHTVEDPTLYRLEEFERFSHLPEHTRREILDIAKEKRISIEQAYHERQSEKPI